MTSFIFNTKWSLMLPLIFATLILHPFSKVMAQESSDMYYDLGVFAYEDANYREAQDLLSKALLPTPENPYYNYYMAKTHVALGLLPESLGFFLKALKQDRQIIGLSFDTGMAYYKLENYGQAEKLFQEALESEPDNILAAYYLGMCHYMVEDYQAAIDIFMDTARQNISVRVNCYYFAGICYSKIDKQEQAIEKFSYVIREAESVAKRKKAARWLDYLKKQASAKKPYNIYLKIQLQYDDNLRLDPNDLDLFTDEDDFVTSIYLSGKYYLARKDNMRYGLGYTFYQNLHADYSNYDLMGNSFLAFYQYLRKPFTFTINYTPGDYRLDSEPYLQRHRINPELSMQVSNKTQISLSYAYTNDDNSMTSSKSGDYNELALGVTHNLLRNGIIYSSFSYKTSSLTDPEEDYDLWKVSLYWLKRVDLLNLDISFSGIFAEKNYQTLNLDFFKKRQDKKLTVGVTLAKPLPFYNLTANFEYKFTTNDSNIEFYKYRRNVVGYFLSTEF